MRRRMTLLALIALLILPCAVTASAQEFDGNRTGSITVTLLDPNDKQPIEGAAFDVYHIATVGINTDKKLNYIYTDLFEHCGIPLEDPALSAKLSAFVEEKTVAAERIVTDAKGVAAYSDLPLGLYLVKQAGAVEGFSACTPFLVTVPVQNGAEYVYDVNASPKTDIVKLVSIQIKKNWNAGKSTQIPDSVTVQLLRDGTVVETATLDKNNDWQITYTDMPQSDAYTIKEVNVPQGYTATYAQNGFAFTVTNTASLAQTGQMIWPIPVLAMAGLFFLLVGFLILRKPGENHA